MWSPTGFCVGPLLFHLYINDFPILTDTPANVIMFVGDTSILVSTKSNENLAQSSNLVLLAISKRLQGNQLVRNPKNTNIIKFTPSKLSALSKYPLKLTYIDQILTDTDTIKFLHLNLVKHLS
jgi:hypothetical protein